jgi:hypothetical protein
MKVMSPASPMAPACLKLQWQDSRQSEATAHVLCSKSLAALEWPNTRALVPTRPGAEGQSGQRRDKMSQSH